MRREGGEREAVEWLANHTGQTMEKIIHDTDRDFFMDATEAKKYGVGGGGEKH